MAIVRPLVLLLLLLLPKPMLAEEMETAESAMNSEWAENIWQSLERQTGQIKLASAQATLNIANNFYFLNAADAEKVLAEVWNTPVDQPILGMILPATQTPFDKNVWAMVIRYEADGYIPDEDAADIGYADLLSAMQDEIQAGNTERLEQGRDPITLIGWAAQPQYDTKQHALHWAEEFQSGEDSLHTLSYNIRVLGRKGVLALSVIADIEQLPAIESQLSSIIGLVSFDPGATYEEFIPGSDKVATQGLSALVVGNTSTQTGFVKTTLLFFKKFGVWLVVGLGLCLGMVWHKSGNRRSQFSRT